MRSLAGKCALITGSVRGLGLAAAQRFAAAGCNLVLNGFGAEQDISTLRSDIERQHGVRTLYDGADLRHRDEIEAMVSKALDSFKTVDIQIGRASCRERV